MKFGGEYEFFRRRKKYSLNLAFNAMLKASIKDKLVLRFSSACFEPYVIVTSFRMINTS
jgi:hypothetical protein